MAGWVAKFPEKMAREEKVRGRGLRGLSWRRFRDCPPVSAYILAYRRAYIILFMQVYALAIPTDLFFPVAHIFTHFYSFILQLDASYCTLFSIWLFVRANKTYKTWHLYYVRNYFCVVINILRHEHHYLLLHRRRCHCHCSFSLLSSLEWSLHHHTSYIII